MARLEQAFDPNEAEGRNDYSPLPTGVYSMQIIDSAWKETKSGSGKYIKLEFEILDGEQTGRKYWENLNLVNPNETAVKIARGTLKEICESVGIFSALEDTEDLHFKPLLADVVCKPRKDDPAQMENNVRKYMPLENGAPQGRVAKSTAGAGAATKSAPATAATGEKKKPWEIHKK